MKIMWLLGVLVCCSVSYASDHEYIPEGNKRPRSITPVSSNSDFEEDEEEKSGLSGSSQSGVSLTSLDENVYIAPAEVETARLILRRVQSAKQEVLGYQAVFSDYPHDSGWPTGRSTKDEYEAKARKKEEAGYYQLKLGFDNYNLHDRQTNAIVGRFTMGNDKNDGKVETTIYLLPAYRGKGFGPEVVASIVKDVVQPGLGQPYRALPFIKGYRRDGEPIKDYLERTGQSAEGVAKLTQAMKTGFIHIPSFLGVHANCDFGNYHRDNDYGSIATHFKGGYGVRWEGKVIMSYPPGETLCSEEVDILVDISRILRDCLRTKINLPDYKSFWGESISAGEMVKRGLYGTKTEELKQKYILLLKTNEPHTLKSALYCLEHDFNMTHKDFETPTLLEKAQTFASTSEPF